MTPEFPPRPWDSFGDGVLLIGAVLTAFYVWRSWRKERAVSSVLRACSFFFLAAVLLEPIFSVRSRQDRVRLAVAVDSSSSMNRLDASEGKETRWGAALSTLEKMKPYFDKNFSCDYFIIDRRAVKISLEDMKKTEPRGASSDLTQIENALKEETEAKAMILLSDGRHGAGSDPVAAAARLGVPLLAVGLGDPRPVRDLVLTSVKSPRFAFKDTDVEVSVHAEARRVPLENYRAEIVEGGRIISSGAVVYSTATGSWDGTLTFRPTKRGVHTYEVRLPVLEGEAVAENNKARFRLDVARNKIRILYLCGRPGPNYSFLRYQLKSNPSVELVSFVILRDPEDLTNVSEKKLSLIPFPSQSLLVKQLPTFDILILEEFFLEKYGLGPLVQVAVREFVVNGGALLFMGDSRILRTASESGEGFLRGILPVEMGLPWRSAPPRRKWDIYEISHPILNLADDPVENASLWGASPPLEGDGWAPAKAPVGAEVLAGFTENGEKRPLLTLRRLGKGRVLSLLSLTTWRWSLEGRDRGLWIYQRFWGNALHWLMGEEDRLVRVVPPEDIISPGDEFLARARVWDENRRPLSTAEVKGVFVSPEGEKTEAIFSPLGNGEYAGRFRSETGGSARVTVTGYFKKKTLGVDGAEFFIGGTWDEKRDVTPDFQKLENMTHVSGGAFTSQKGFTREWLEKNLEPAAWTYEKKFRPGRSRWLFLLGILFLFAEWFLRRQRGRV